MITAIVDTDVVSLIFKGHSRANSYRALLSGHLLAISFMTLAELDRWPLERRWGQRRIADFSAYLERFVVLQSSRDLCKFWASVKSAADRIGRPIDTADAWIAATAILYDIPLITNNPADYEMISTPTIQPG